jgi:hypothetical protein
MNCPKCGREMKLLSWFKLEIGVWEGIFEDFKASICCTNKKV